MQPFTHRVRSGRKHVAREPHLCELTSLDSKSSRIVMLCRSNRRVKLKTGRRLRSHAMIYADRDPPVIISRACSARLPAERRASSPAEPTTFTPGHFWTGQIQFMSVLDIQKCPVALTVSPSRRMGDATPRAPAPLAGRSVSEPRALAERVGVYCLALAPRLSPQATAFFDER